MVLSRINSSFFESFSFQFFFHFFPFHFHTFSMKFAFACVVLLLGDVESSPTPTFTKAIVPKALRAVSGLSGSLAVRPFTGGSIYLKTESSISSVSRPNLESPDLTHASDLRKAFMNTNYAAKEPVKFFEWEAPLTNQPVEYEDGDSLVKLYAKFVHRNPVVLQQILLDGKIGVALVYFQLIYEQDEFLRDLNGIKIAPGPWFFELDDKLKNTKACKDCL
jgi:hypothetical protein